MAVSRLPEKVFILRNSVDLARAVTALSKINPTKDKPYTIKISLEDESRSDKQNRLAFMWYQLLGTMTGHGKEHERCRCKLHYGIPILREEEEFNSFYKQALIRLTYEQKLVAMEYVPVTSLMTVRQFARYLTTIDEESAAQGHVLPHPDDLYYDALMKEGRHAT